MIMRVWPCLIWEDDEILCPTRWYSAVSETGYTFHLWQFQQGKAITNYCFFGCIQFSYTHTHLTVHSTRMCTSLIVRSLTIRFASLISHAKTGIFWFLIEHGGVPWFPEWISWRIFRVIFTTVWRVVFLSIKKLRDFSLQNTINIHKW